MKSVLAFAGGHFYFRLYGSTLRLLWGMLESGECLKWLRSLWTWFLRNSCFVSWRWHVSQWWPPLQASSRFFLLSLSLYLFYCARIYGQWEMRSPSLVCSILRRSNTDCWHTKWAHATFFILHCLHFCRCQPLQKLWYWKTNAFKVTLFIFNNKI